MSLISLQNERNFSDNIIGDEDNAMRKYRNNFMKNNFADYKSVQELLIVFGCLYKRVFYRKLIRLFF